MNKYPITHQTADTCLCHEDPYSKYARTELPPPVPPPAPPGRTIVEGVMENDISNDPTNKTTHYRFFDKFDEIIVTILTPPVYVLVGLLVLALGVAELFKLAYRAYPNIKNWIAEKFSHMC